MVGMSDDPTGAWVARASHAGTWRACVAGGADRCRRAATHIFPSAESIFPAGGDTKPSAVMPAKAGIHSHRPVFMDSGFRGCEEIRKDAGSASRVLRDGRFAASSG